MLEKSILFQQELLTIKVIITSEVSVDHLRPKPIGMKAGLRAREQGKKKEQI